MAQPATTTQPTTTTPPARNPVLGTPGAKPAPASRRAADIARSDKQPPGTMNGNQPDRAAAAGGGR